MPSLSAADRGAYENLILLCPSCHTMIDKAEEAYPDHAIQDWKREHKSRIAAAFGANLYPDRPLVRNAIEPLLSANKGIFDAYGPNHDYRFDPESETAVVWKRKVLAHICPTTENFFPYWTRIADISPSMSGRFWSCSDSTLTTWNSAILAIAQPRLGQHFPME